MTTRKARTPSVKSLARSVHCDGPASQNFAPVRLRGGRPLRSLAGSGVSDWMAECASHALLGAGVAWGIPFHVGRVFVVHGEPQTIPVNGLKAPWIIVRHTSDLQDQPRNADGFYPATTGPGRLNEHAADYVFVYADGSEVRWPIRCRYEVGDFQRIWGENNLASVAAHKPMPITPVQERRRPHLGAWGRSQQRVHSGDDSSHWVDWLCAWENPHPRKIITAIRLEPRKGALVLSAITGGKASAHPLRWARRQKALLRMPRGVAFDPTLDAEGCLSRLQIDMGQVISAVRQPDYPDAAWSSTPNNSLPEAGDGKLLIEYTAHPDAHFHLEGGRSIPVSSLKADRPRGRLTVVRPADQTVQLRVVEKGNSRPVPVRLHVHGEAGEYLAPIDRHRIPNPAWFEDYSVDYLHQGRHWCTYIAGETTIKLPLGRVYIEVSRGFEIRPRRLVKKISRSTAAITIELERVLDWRARGWVTADTHVHFISPSTAMFEGAAEGVNVVNLLASQWGEMMSNVGDFDGTTTFGSKAAGGDGEHLVRVGTENRQHVLGHISLLGYEGKMISPMCSGGPGESALGDPVEVLMTEWARQCKAQNGLVVMPHIPNPRLENAATIVAGDVDAVEIMSQGRFYDGISAYALSDWYRYLNCGIFVPIVGGTDKMAATTPIGAIRTYTRVPDDQEFTYANWMQAVRGGDTFCSFGPLVEFAVDGRRPGSRMRLRASGGSVDITWEVASVTVPMTRVDLIINGEIRESVTVDPEAASGTWRIRLERSSWIALLVRGHEEGHPEIIAAHTSPIMVAVGDQPFFAAADAITILEQVEGALAYIDTIGTRAETIAYKRMRTVLTGIHREFHNRMHHMGVFHKHTPKDKHDGHHHHA